MWDGLPLGRRPTSNRLYGHTVKNFPRTREQQYRYKIDRINALKHFYLYDRTRSVLSLLLDNSLITQSCKKKYSIKIIQCGDYYQVYRFNKTKLKKADNYSALKNYIGKEYIYTDMLVKRENYVKNPSSGEVEKKNIERSKYNMQRLVKANEDEFKTFITLTFEENLTDIKLANKKFNVWRRNIKRLKNDFKYVCVPEFQKRGAVHYHLLTNIDYNDFSILSQSERKIWNKKNKQWQVGRDIKGWIYGINMAKDMKNVNVVGYMSKYMTKDIDNRLFGHRRYFYSNNLIKPSERYIDLSDDKDFMFFADLMANSKEKFNYAYCDVFGELVDFTEYKLEENREDFPAKRFSSSSDNIY